MTLTMDLREAALLGQKPVLGLRAISKKASSGQGKRCIVTTNQSCSSSSSSCVARHSDSEIRQKKDKLRLADFRSAPASLVAITSMSGAARADVLESIQGSGSLVQKDTIIGIAFGTAILALGAVTLGVLYLSASTWNDKRVEKAERASFEQALKDRESRAQQEVGKPVRKVAKKKKELVGEGERKGFGR